MKIYLKNLLLKFIKIYLKNVSFKFIKIYLKYVLLKCNMKMNKNYSMNGDELMNKK